RRQMLGLMTGATGAMLLHACQPPTRSPSVQSPGTSRPSKTATMGLVVWTGNAPLYVARSQGLFEKLGLNLDIKTFSTNPDAAAAFSTGRIDGWAAVTSEAVLLAARGKDFRVVLVQDSSVGADGILARNRITDLKDFKGKRVAVEEGAVSHFFLLQSLATVGLTDRDITIVNVAPDAAAAAYQAGQAEIAVSYSPFLEQANAAQKDGRIIFDSSKIPTAITDLYLFDTQFINQNPEAIQAFVDGCFQGLDVLQQKPQEANPIAAKELGVSPEELQTNLKGLKLPDRTTNLEMLNNPQSELHLLKSMDAMAQFLLDQKKITKRPDLSQLLEPRFVLAAK
ncbi:MAG: ABC transporter substrate-binding protein, partial [Leptolyngbyaceae cyanobacterium bins.59]|nr:ABC transporter substrate-binding protein [Leptolyngbyaceae cyanobacterium bins.59]